MFVQSIVNSDDDGDDGDDCGIDGDAGWVPSGRYGEGSRHGRSGRRRGEDGLGLRHGNAVAVTTDRRSSTGCANDLAVAASVGGQDGEGFGHWRSGRRRSDDGADSGMAPTFAMATTRKHPLGAAPPSLGNMRPTGHDNRSYVGAGCATDQQFAAATGGRFAAATGGRHGEGATLAGATGADRDMAPPYAVTTKETDAAPQVVAWGRAWPRCTP
jgi:hypothetical protein